MPGVVAPQQKPGMMQQAMGGLQTAQAVMSMKNSMSQPGTDPNAAGATGSTDQAARGGAIQRRLDRP